MRGAQRNPLWSEPGPAATCATCAWRYRGGRGRAVDRCRRHGDSRIEPDWSACPAHETELDCASCAACCREAYDAVEVSRRDPFARAHRDLLVVRMGHLSLPRREDGSCPCLTGEPGSWRCTAYEDRPRSCREFERGGANCLDARRRLGLTP